MCQALSAQRVASMQSLLHAAGISEERQSLTSCLTLCDSMGCSPPASSVYGIFQARTLEWVAISSSRGSARTRDRIRVFCISCIGRCILYHWATWEDDCFNATKSLLLNSGPELMMSHFSVYLVDREDQATFILQTSGRI